MTMQKDIYILAIETSCDETAASVVKNGRYVLSNVISSQINLHKKYGGVVPEIASRNHIKKINIVINEAIEKSGINLKDINAIGVTYGPGLVGALLVGLSTAKALAFATKKPLIGVHHIEGHISANYIENKDFAPPFICLIVSGGHTHLVYVKDYGDYEILGKTRDDAAGEAYDKIARAIGLGYPGGPKIDKLAKEGDPHSIEFPRAYMEDGSLDFSFSGLKSAVLNYLNKCKMTGECVRKENVAASFQQAIIDVLVDKTIQAAKLKNINKIALAGGVSANTGLRQAMNKVCERENIFLQYPSPILCTDNAAMIGSAAYFEYIKGIRHGLDLNAIPNLKLGESV
ncbi:tRNA (adenosine(37)-N6)-threonylcarbamoyltransferase complex transferase subunit TsaD [Defluviitalea phaphyphila]|uniref:tRNA (adenosine(37)-N6)-threonylcarbamoyltransferase complex transferase subunit TsaD n=1 Tax=Defluviitalea phaphyphila TaxID=1473580 RepID=UPI000731D197|nr:tRNA (adenosine(37)-N6)-threonylcarbamoyltransferase complex transferase subunit TsaD [Defluviitalea phaphyphila]